MNEQHNNSKPASGSQDPGEEIEVEASLNDMATSVLKGLLYRRPPEFWGDWLEDALKAILDIAESLNAIHEDIDALCDIGERIAQGQDKQIEAYREWTEAIKEYNRLLRGGRDADS